LAQDKPLAIDLFSGAGGLSLGLERAGFCVALAVDSDRWCLETHRHNVPGLAMGFDLSEPDRLDALVRFLEGVPIDLVAGGPPCQPFSRAGRSKLRSLVEDGTRPEEDDRTELWQSFLEVVERVGPTSVLMENVPDMALGDDLQIIRVLEQRLERLGYDVESKLVDAWRFGVPQHRQRLILMGRKDGRALTWPRQGRRVTLRDAIGDLPRLGSSTGDVEMRARPPKTAFQRAARRGMNGLLWDHVSRPVRDDDREAFALMKPGTRYGDLPAKYRRYRDDIFNDKYNRLAWDDLSRSITAHIAKDGYWYIHPSEHRTLSVREAARVQTFPDRFRFAGTRSHAFRQIGNAVPPALGEALGRALKRGGEAPVVPKRERLSAKYSELRSRIQRWAERDSKRAPWRHPGDSWLNLAGAVLGDRTGARDRGVEEFVTVFPAPGRGVAKAVRKAASATEDPMRDRLSRLADAAEVLVRAGGRSDPERWIAAARLNNPEELFVRVVGLDEDKILLTTPSLRVVGRVTGTRVHAKNRLSNGRMELGRLVGYGEDASRISAGIHALGRTICRADEPDCDCCPLRVACARYGRAGRSR
jgi:DNA (cytosine-5)-methyltransferase 1